MYKKSNEVTEYIRDKIYAHTAKRLLFFPLKLKISLILSGHLEGSEQYTLNSNLLLKGWKNFRFSTGYFQQLISIGLKQKENIAKKLKAM